MYMVLKSKHQNTPLPCGLITLQQKLNKIHVIVPVQTLGDT